MTSRRARALSGRGGFTLLEVLVAVTVLGVALVALLGLHARNVRLAAEERELTIAGLLASGLAAKTRAGPFPEEGALSGTFGDDDGFGGDFNEEYGGDLGSRYTWTRTVTKIGLINVHSVRVAVGVEQDSPLVSFEFLVRRGGP